MLLPLMFLTVGVNASSNTVYTSKTGQIRQKQQPLLNVKRWERTKEAALPDT